MLSKRQQQKLRKIGKLISELLRDCENGSTEKESRKRTRRAGKELVAFRNMLKSEREKGVPVSQLAERHGVSTAYVYSLK